MKKALKTLLILSFAPYVFLLGCGIYSAFAGFGFFFSTSYGFDAFRDCIVFMGFLLCWYPVIPICLIYQIIYLIICIVHSRRRSRTSQGQSAVE